VELEALHEQARKNNALLAKLITIAMERVRRTHELLANLRLGPTRRESERDPDTYH
jgi:hypothetical protein